jgi:hypothetical protein
MKMKHWIQAAAVTTAVGVLLSTAVPAPAQISVGDSVSFTFRSEVLNGMGIDELADLKGKPILVEFWGTR